MKNNNSGQNLKKENDAIFCKLRLAEEENRQLKRRIFELEE
jgi:hypothetical protein